MFWVNVMPIIATFCLFIVGFTLVAQDPNFTVAYFEVIAISLR